MFHLILTLIAIAMAGLSLFAQVQYLNPVAKLAQEERGRLEAAFLVLEDGYYAYVAATGAKPSLLSEITPAYAFLPAAPAGLAWSFGAGGYNGEGRWFCLSGQAGPAAYRAILKLRDRLSPQAYFVAETCGAIQSAPPPEGGSGSTLIAATYWVETYVQRAAEAPQEPDSAPGAGKGKGKGAGKGKGRGKGVVQV